MLSLPIFKYVEQQLENPCTKFAMIGLWVTANGTKIYTSWLITASEDTLIQIVPYLTMMNSTAVRSVHEKI